MEDAGGDERQGPIWKRAEGVVGKLGAGVPLIFNSE